MKFIGIAIGLIILASFGCNRSNHYRSSESQVEWAYQLIDEGQYTEAIDLFWNLLHEEDTPTIRIGLASAYAARAGIQVQSYWDLVLPLVKAPPAIHPEANQKIKIQWESMLNTLPIDLRENLNHRSNEILRAHEQLEEIIIRFQQIPPITTMEQVGDIMMARSVIKDVQSKGTHLYRGLLTLVLLSFQVNQSIQEFQMALQSINPKNPCPAQFKNWITNLELPLNFISDLILDLKIAYPSKLNELIPFEEQFINYRSVFSSLIPLLGTNLCLSL